MASGIHWETQMRLSEIEKPKGLFLRIAYWFIKRKYGKVFTPLKVVYARKPDLMHIGRRMNKIQEKSFNLDPSYQILIYTYCSFLNGCHFCQDLWLANAVKMKIGTGKFQALSGNTIDAEDFTEKEMAIIAFVKEYAENKSVCDEVFEGLKAHFTDEEIVEILAVNAFECFYSALLVPLGLQSDGLVSLANVSES